MKNNIFQPILVLSTICIVVALLLSAINMITAPIIESAQNQAANEALLQVLPDGKNFKEIDLSSDNYPKSVVAGYSADGGYVFQMSVSGKSSGLIIMCGIDSDGKVVGTQVIASEETPGYAEKVYPEVEGTDGKYKGMDFDNFDPYLVTGATLTSKAYGEAVQAALMAASRAMGKDAKTPEEIFQINCNAALGTQELVFTKWFAMESFAGIDSIYEASDKSGRVYIIGETMIGVKSGAVMSEGISEENKSTVLAADTAINALTFENVAKPEGAKATINSIKKASNGTYIFELSAEGYQAVFDWGDGTTISVMLSISADGKIIDVITVSHKETNGYGADCSTEEYYEQYRGKADADIVISADYPLHDGTDLIPSTSTDVGIIASATYTTVGYQTAVKDAFAAFNLITAEGGNEQ